MALTLPTKKHSKLENERKRALDELFTSNAGRTAGARSRKVIKFRLSPWDAEKSAAKIAKMRVKTTRKLIIARKLRKISKPLSIFAAKRAGWVSRPRK